MAAVAAVAAAAEAEGELEADRGAVSAFDERQFSQVLQLPALRVPPQKVGELQKDGKLKAMMYRRRNMRNVLPAGGDAAAGQRLVLLQPGTSAETLPDVAKKLLDSGAAELVEHALEVGYEQTTAEEALQRLLPQGVEVPRGFETVGHLAHFNLREPQLPYRKVIGKVILDKNPCIKTVVTKVGSLSNEFRTFDMEVIGGRDDTDVTVCERKLKLKFDFRQVYWNSKLSEERVRLLEQVGAEDVVCDLFAGIGAFSIMCAEKGCTVHANDLNPAGAAAIRKNAALNHVEMDVYNMCARECVKMLSGLARLPARSCPTKVHVIMNLPELALDFLDAFREMVETRRSSLFSGSPVELVVHCHCFAREKSNPDAEIHPRLIAAMGCVPEGTRAREVRDVAPKKNMYCVEFSIRLDGGLTVSDRGAEDAKRQKTQ